jgi:hypothetical protein
LELGDAATDLTADRREDEDAALLARDARARRTLRPISGGSVW